MILPFLFALLAFLVILPILKPLMTGGRPVAERSQFDQAVYLDQLQELERDIARGLMTPVEAEMGRLEIQRRLLTASRTKTAPARLSRSPAMAAFVLVLVGGGSVLAYTYLGSPNLPDMPFSSRTQEAQTSERAHMQEAVAQLAERLRQNPKDPAGWLMFARSLSTLGDWNRAASAYQQAISLGESGPDVEAEHAEMMVMQAGGTVTPAAEASFQKVLSADHDNAMARYYLAVARLQAGEPKQAIDGLQGLLAILPSNSPLRPQIGEQVARAAKAAGIPTPELAKGGPAVKIGTAGGAPAEAPAGGGPGPNASEMAQAAGMPAAQREAMIRSMVGRLAAKQESDPNNFDGWMRLGRAYAVLKEQDKAAAAYAKAQALRPDDLSVPESEVEALLADYKPGEAMPARVVDLLRRINAKDPKQPMALWYLGLAAAQSGHADEAKQRWHALAEQLPKESNDRRMVEAAIATLSNGGSGKSGRVTSGSDEGSSPGANGLGRGTPNGTAASGTASGTASGKSGGMADGKTGAESGK